MYALGIDPGFNHAPTGLALLDFGGPQPRLIETFSLKPRCGGDWQRRCDDVLDQLLGYLNSIPQSPLLCYPMAHLRERKDDEAAPLRKSRKERANGTKVLNAQTALKLQDLGGGVRGLAVALGLECIAVQEAQSKVALLIEQTPTLDWLLLTKRPENMIRFAPTSWADGWPASVWAMTSVEDQQRADERIPALLRVPAQVRGLSCEPLLGDIWLRPEWLYDPCPDGCGCIRPDDADANECACRGLCCQAEWDDRPRKLQWIIAGGESGPDARPMHPDWARSLRSQCQAAGVAFFMKQWGEYCPGEFQREGTFIGYWRFQQGSTFHEEAHGLPEHYHFQGPPDGRYRTWPVVRPWPDVACLKLGKKWSGRMLDGRMWNEFPEVAVLR